MNNYTISGSDSAAGLERAEQARSRSRAGTAGRSSSTPRTGKVSAQQSAVNQSVSNVSKLPDVIKAVSPFASSSYRRRVQDGTIAYASVGWNVNPNSLDTSYLDKLNNAVAPATKAGLQVEYGGGAGEIGQKTSDLTSEVIGLACALVLLLIMFWLADGGRDPAGVGDLQRARPGSRCSRCSPGWSRSPPPPPRSPRCSGSASPWTTGCSWWPGTGSSWTAGMGVVPSVRLAAGTSGAAIVVAGSTVAVSVLGLYISGVGFVGALGLAAALVVVVTMISALTLVPAFMGLVREGVRALFARVRAHKEGLTAQQQAAADRRGHAGAARAQRVRPVGADGERPSLAVGGGERGGAARAGDPAVLHHAGPAGQRDEPHLRQQPTGV